MADVEKLYMQNPLVLWVETLKPNDGHPLEYRDLYDGVYLNDVMQQIDPRLTYDNVNRCGDDNLTVRLHNWDLLVRNIKAFYKDVLQQLLVMRLPNVHLISREPLKDSSFAEIRKALLLILGCAVQCEQKEAFIDKIMAMDITAQTEIVENIKEITDDNQTVLPTQRPETPKSCETYIDKMFHHLFRLIKERDDCAELVADLGQERDFYMSQAEGKPVINTPQLSPDKHHLALELAECKAKLRHVRQELEDRQEQLSDAKDELKEVLATCAHLKNENAALQQEARITRTLRDELDIVKEKAVKVDVYEKEILKYKEKLNELEFYKARTSELKEDNSILEETKAMLEDQLTNSRKRIETVVELEAELGRYRQQIEQLSQERESDKEKIEYLTEENARLEFEKKSSLSESVSLESELSAVKSRIGNLTGSMSEQILETSHAKVLRLELENQRLAAKLAEMRETAMIQSAEVSLELEKENKRLANKVEKLQANVYESSERMIEIEGQLTSSREETQRVMKVLETVKENSERQVNELERENERLTQTLHTIQERCELTSDVKMKDLERENKRLHETVAAKNSQLTQLEFDHRQLQRSSHQLQEGTQRLKDLEQENQFYEKQIGELHQKVATLEYCEEKLETIEQENSDLSVENRKLKKTVETLQLAAQRREQMEQEHISLTIEHQRLQKTLESLKSESDRALELEAEKDELNKELQQLRKCLEGQKTQKLRQEQMEFDLMDVNNENQRLQKGLEMTNRRLQQLEKDNVQMETENENLNKQLETMRLTAKKLEDKENEVQQMDFELQKLTKDKSALEKENKKLKQSSDLKDSSMEETMTKYNKLDQECKLMKKSVEKLKETSNKVKELEKENSQLLQELNTDRRTLATLREDLINEKINSQELNNQLEQLTGELERIGLNTDKMVMVEQSNDANRYKALEVMIEETLKKSNELKDEKIRSLEIRLDESKNRNLKLQDELRSTKSETEVLKQRIEEELETTNLDDDRVKQRLVKTESALPTKELFQLKDRLVELERKNARLMADNDNLQANNSDLKEHCQKLENQLTSFQSQHASLQGYYSSLQEQNAKLQVEYTTVQSQISSTLSQQDVLKNQMSRLELDYENLSHKHEGLHNVHQSLVSDHESLQHLHQQLTAEYESLVSEHGSMKAIHKSLKSEYKVLSEQMDAMLQGKDDVNKLREVMEKERDHLKKELMAVGNLQSNYNRLCEDHQQQAAAYDKLSRDYSDVLASHKQIKTEYNNLQLKATELQVELNEAKENLTVADMEFQKLENKMEAVYQINERIENENQALLMQIKQLLNQNQDLLTKTLSSKDHFVEEEKHYLEKLAELRRQKERLEEKIMEHYKNRISPKKRGLGAILVNKARNIMSRGPKRSKSRNNLNEMGDSIHSSEQMNDTAHRLGSKSSENVNESNNNDYSTLPGLGRPYEIDELNSSDRRSITPGPSRRIPGNISPGSEMLTLHQFLKEANGSSSNSKTFDEIKRSHDSDSRSSDNSSSSFNSRYKPGISHFRSDVPDIAISTHSYSSRLSAESGNADSSFSSNGHLPYDVYTSTPKAEFEGQPTQSAPTFNNSLARPGGELRRQSSEEVASAFHQPHRHSFNDNWKNSNQESHNLTMLNRSTPQQGSSAPSKVAGSFQQASSSPRLPYPQNSASFRGRETLPPEKTSAVERLDRLTRGEQMQAPHYAQPNKLFNSEVQQRVNSGFPRTNDRDFSDHDRRQPFGTPPSVSNPQHAPPSAPHQQAPPSAPHQQQAPATISGPSRSRPISAMAHSGPTVRGVYSRPHGDTRPKPQQGIHPNQPLPRDRSLGRQAAENIEAQNRSQLTERPKSVPPQLFNKSEGNDRINSQVQSVGSRDFQREAPEGREPRNQPMPKVALLREPSRSSSRSGAPIDPQHYISASGSSHGQYSSPQQHPGGQQTMRQNSLPLSVSDHQNLGHPTRNSMHNPSVASRPASSTNQFSSPKPEALPTSQSQHESRSSSTSSSYSLSNFSNLNSPSTALPPDAIYSRSMTSPSIRRDNPQPVHNNSEHHAGHQQDSLTNYSSSQNDPKRGQDFHPVPQPRGQPPPPPPKRSSSEFHYRVQSGQNLSPGQSSYPYNQNQTIQRTTSRPDTSMNGPSGPVKDFHSPQYNSNLQQNQVTPPQIRTQGKLPGGPNSNILPNRHLSSGPQYRSPGEASSDESKNPSSPQSATNQVSNEQKNSPSAPVKPDAEAGQPNRANSIWYEYGCV
ncbi:girdin-like isoform X3 [Biomphalaria glabrata]|uniref:Girdin-like isoform X3 n=1 Tax=Biomphalaria glabrata TaxID=6526 RepID=A0A9W2ZX82_BIOGL|nr:girdin-like isoform X3 [Biomphalaria glabrata]